MNVSLRTLTLLAVVAAQVNAFAEEKTDKPAEKTLVPYGLIHANLNLANSQSGSAPDFTTKEVRLGVKVTEGITRAQFETQYLGNLPQVGYPQIGGGIVNAKAATFNGVTIRRADLGLSLPSGTDLALGRTRMGGADLYGVDPTETVDGFGSIDGASITQKISLGNKDELTLALGVGNSMGVPGGKDSNMWGTSLKTDRGIIVGARAKVQGISAAAYFGMEKNQVKQVYEPEQIIVGPNGRGIAADGSELPDPSKLPEGTKPADATRFVTLKKLMTAADVSHFEGTVGYSLDNLSAGLWYQSITTSDLKVARFVDGKFKTASIEDTDLTFGVKRTPKKVETKIGFGFNTDSSLIGYTDVLQKGGLLNLGGSVVKLAERDADSSNDSEEEKSDILQVALGVGYQAGGFSLELGHEFNSSKAEQFFDKNSEQNLGNPAKAKPSKKTANYTYLTGAYSF